MEEGTTENTVSKSASIEQLEVKFEYACSDDGRAYFARSGVVLAVKIMALVCATRL